MEVMDMTPKGVKEDPTRVNEALTALDSANAEAALALGRLLTALNRLPRRHIELAELGEEIADAREPNALRSVEGAVGAAVWYAIDDATGYATGDVVHRGAVAGRVRVATSWRE